MMKRKPIALAVIAAAALIGLSGCSEPEAPAGTLLNQAVDKAAEGNWATADQFAVRAWKQDKNNADALIRSANASIEIERKKASADIKSEIADVSAAIAEKVLGREINEEDHKDLIDSFIDEIEADNDK